jgi:hypothetical protein
MSNPSIPKWIRFRRGDHLETSEIKSMHKEIVSALALLQKHPDAGAMYRVALMDLGKIEGFLHGRKINERS